MYVIEIIKWLDIVFLAAACLFMIFFILKVRQKGK